MNRKSFGFLFLMILLCAQSISAATVNGNAFKDGQTDHSGITIDLEPLLQPIPTIGITGLLLLVMGFSFFLLRKRSRAVMIPMVVCLFAGLSCITYAAMRASTVTNSLGEYIFADVEPGGYSIDASAPGYYPEYIANFTVIDGASTAPTITLYPIATPTQVPTDTPTMTPTETPIPAGHLISTDDIVGNMRYVPAGTFTQGSPGTEPCRGSDETHFTHTLTRNLAVMETEVTRQMWADLRAVQDTLPADPSTTSISPTLSHPLQMNTWYESVLFANLLSLQNGYTLCYYTDAGFTAPIDSTNYALGSYYCNFNADGYRLPTEGEWEYFTRAGTTTPFSCNETNYNESNCHSYTSGTHATLEQYCVYCVNDPGLTAVVRSKLPNPWELYDVHGNVWEWCWDWYSTYPTGSATDYTGVTSGSERIIRGNSWLFFPARFCRSAQRHTDYPNGRSYAFGLRLVRTVP